MNHTRPIPLEDLSTRDPEWEALEPGPGHEAMNREVEWDPVHGDFKVKGFIVVNDPPERPAP